MRSRTMMPMLGRSFPSDIFEFGARVCLVSLFANGGGFLFLEVGIGSESTFHVPEGVGT